MPINLIEYASADGISQLVIVAIEEFADEIEARDLIDGCDEIFQTITGAVQRWKRGDDVCYQVTGGMLSKNGGTRSLEHARTDHRRFRSAFPSPQSEAGSS